MYSRFALLCSKEIGFRFLTELQSLAGSRLCGIVTLDDREDARSRFEDIRAFCAEHAIPCHVASGPREARQALESLKPDVCFVAGWYWIIPPELLRLAPGGFIGNHPSLLPRYRGMAPLVWQIIAGEPEVGTTLFYFSDGMDEGDIIGQARIPVAADEYIDSVLEKVAAAAAGLLRAAFPRIADGTVVRVPQPREGSTYCALRRPEDGEIDWSSPARVVFNFVRAQSHPYPGAFTFADGKKLTVCRARPIEVSYLGRPGQVARFDGGEVWVVCGGGTVLALKTVRVDGGPEVPAAEAVRTIRLRLGVQPLVRA